MTMRSAATLLAVLVACAAWGNGDRVYIECPCTATRDGESLTVAAGLRSFRKVDTGALRMEVRAAESQAAKWWRAEKLGVASLVATVAAETTVEGASYSTVATDAAGVRHVRLVLQEEHGGNWVHQDEIRMAGAVDVAADFTVHDLDYLADTDGDGVGDVNEGLEGTDPADAESTPGSSTIDVVALYSQGFPALYDNDPTTRIQHLFSVANTYLADSQLALEFRLVGVAPSHVDEDDEFSVPDIAMRTAEAERHGADLVVVFRPVAPNRATCGWASGVGAHDQRGYIDLRAHGQGIATVMGDCGARTLAHEIGHLLGLAHSVWQGDRGTWRWSRGHGVEDDFHTIMSYGRGGWDPSKNRFTMRPANVFSGPDGRCTGEQMVAKPCGVGHAEVDAADARTSIDAVRFQFARFREEHGDGDGDGFVDPVDAFPGNAAEWWDTDADGVGNNADADDDNDGVDDAADWRPLDSSESADRDADGVGDNADAFPDDPAETADTDGDGVGDNADEFPNDPLETVDTDGDGVGDNGDAFPDDPAESVDTDGDGVGDNADPDADADGVNDIRDAYPRDASRSDLASWKLVGEAPGDELGGGAVTAADLDGDGVVELIVGAASHGGFEDAPRTGALYVVSAGDLPWMDSQDGEADRVVDLAFAAPAGRSWKVVGAAYDHVGSALAVGDVDGDGVSEIVVGAWDKDTVYLLEAADLGAFDAKDGRTDGVVDIAHVGGGTGSWKLVGERRSRFGYDVAVGDADGDRLDDLLIGADRERIDEIEWAGAAYHLSGRHLARADSADGAADGVIALSSAVTAGAAVRFVGAAGEADRVGGAVSLAGDFDGDGRRELVIGAPDRGTDELQNAGIVHILSGRVLRAADRLDGDADGVVELPGTHALARSWRVVGDERWQLVGGFVTAGAMRAGDPASLVIGTIHGNSTYVLAGRDLSAADAEDGAVDGSITARNIASQPDSWEMAGLRHRWQWRGRPLAAVGDYDADGTADILLGADRWDELGVGVLFSADELAAFRQSDVASGRLELHPWADWDVPAWRFAGPAQLDRAGSSVSLAGDIDGDGAVDIAIGAKGDDTGGGDAGAVYLVLAEEMGALDRLDGTADRRAALGNLAGDTDGDGIGNTTDPDDDDDGVRDVEDRFQLDGAEWSDADDDGYGDNGDAFPNDRDEWLDTDFDGVGNNADDDDDGDGISDEDERESGMELDTDNDGLANDVDADDDNDGVADADDAFPVDAGEQSDTDGDGVGNHADRDDDGDRVADKNDAFPLDPSETNDADGDGTGDNADAFPNDPAEWVDTDADGIGNNADTDDDGDGVADADDDLPLDATGSVDTDGDGVADPNDAFPSDADEWADHDGDGTGDKADADDDNDGVADVEDLFPKNAARWDLASFKFVATAPGDRLGSSVAGVGDVDGDGHAEILLAAARAGGRGSFYLVSTADLADADASDGLEDGRIATALIARQARSMVLTVPEGYRSAGVVGAIGDVGGDGLAEFGVSAKELKGALYVVSAVDLLAADADDSAADRRAGLDAVAAQPGSWKVRGGWGKDLGTSLTQLGDANGDGLADLLVGLPSIGVGNHPGSARMLDAAALAVIDALDGDADGVLYLYGEPVEGDSRLVGEAAGDFAAAALAVADFDADGEVDFVVGAPGHDAVSLDSGAVYIVSSRDWASADAADGASDDWVALEHTYSNRHSWKIVGQFAGDRAGEAVATGDVDGDGVPDLVIGAAAHDAADQADNGAVYVISGTRHAFARHDLADGTRDGVIQLGTVGTKREGWKLIGVRDRHGLGHALEMTNDVDGDGLSDILVAGRCPDVAHVLGSVTDAPHSAAPAPAFDASKAHGEVRLGAAAGPAVWSFVAGCGDNRRPTVSIGSAGDLDGDGLTDFLIGFAEDNDDGASAAYLVNAADLPHLDAADRTRDRVIHLHSIVRPRR